MTMPTLASRTGRAVYALGWVGIVAALVGVVTAVVWLTWPYAPPLRATQTIRVEPRAVQAGTRPTYTVAYCVDARLPLPVQVDRELELQDSDGLLIYLAPPIAYAATQRCETRHVAILVPSYVPAGVYRLRTHLTIDVNPLRTLRQLWTSERFAVLP